MMRVSELQGAPLDYWTARAEGIPAEQLTIRRVQRSTEYHCVESCDTGMWALNYSTDWDMGGPLIERYQLFIYYEKGAWRCEHNAIDEPETGDTPLQAICRAVVRAAFGDEVADH